MCDYRFLRILILVRDLEIQKKHILCAFNLCLVVDRERENHTRNVGLKVMFRLIPVPKKNLWTLFSIQKAVVWMVIDFEKCVHTD